MPTMRVAGLEMHFREHGDGVPVLLGHSSAAGSGQWRVLIDGLSARYRVLAPDHVGYGNTASYHGDAPLITVEIGLLDSLLQRMVVPCHLIGHSYGGSLMARLAVRRPKQVRSLTLIEPTLFYLLAPFDRHTAHAEIAAVAERLIDDVAAGEPERAARDFIAYWVGHDAFDAMEPRRRQSVIAAMPKVAAEWPAAFEAWGATPRALGELGVPVHLMQGGASTLAARSVMEVLTSLWPCARQTLIDGAGHMGPITHPQRFNPAIADFLADVDRTPRTDAS